jgi:hypothetical protein
MRDVSMQARSNKSANKPDTELNEFEGVSHGSQFSQGRVDETFPSRFSRNIDAGARTISSSRNALKARRLPLRNERHGDVRQRHAPPFRSSAHIRYQPATRKKAATVEQDSDD